MISPSSLTLSLLLGGGLVLADPALAQTTSTQTAPPQAETPAQARARAATQSLNAGPADSVLRPRPNAQPPLSDAERGRAATPVVPPRVAPPAQAQVRTPTPPATRNATTQTPVVRPPAATAPATTRPQPQVRAQTRAPAPGRTPTTPPAAGQARQPSVLLPAGATAPEPIPMTLGYYVRGDKSCAQVWPGEGDIAWLTPTAFTIDFGGCEPGQFLQTGPNTWGEEQKCHTELGGDAGAYNVTYEVVDTGTIKRTAKLALDGSTEEDVWKFCRPQDIPQEARFRP